MSRRHARIFERDGVHWIEDLGSHHGTRVNGERLEGSRALKPGDLVEVGPVEMAYVPAVPGSAPDRSGPHGTPVDIAVVPTLAVGSGAQRAIDRAPTAPNPVPIDRVPTAPAPAAAQAPAPDARTPTPSDARLAPVLPPLPAALIARLADAAPPSPADPLALTPRDARLPGADQDGPTEIPEDAPPPRSSGPKPKLPPDAPARASGPKPRPQDAAYAPPPPRPSGPKPKLAAADGAAPPPSPRPSGPKPHPAAEITDPLPPRDPLDAVTEAKVAATPPPRWPRRGWVLAALGLALGGALAVALHLFWTAEPGSLGPAPLRGSFGAGAGVTWPTPAGKTFRYMPGRGPAVALLHYRAGGFASGELELVVNGQRVKALEPTGEGADARETEVVLPWEAVAAGAMEISFVPRGNSTWRVDAAWVEEVQVPDGGQDALFAEAKEYAAKGRELLDRSPASPDALFLAWKAYRLAWISLEPVRPHPVLHAEALAKYEAIGRTLDEQCDGLLQAAQRSLAQGDVHSAKETLDTAVRYFPSGEHRCHNRAEQLLSENGL